MKNSDSNSDKVSRSVFYLPYNCLSCDQEKVFAAITINQTGELSITDADFSNLSLPGVNFSKIFLKNVSFKNSILYGSVFGQTENVDFDGAECDRVKQ